jgi:hypothetical protein
MCGPTGRRELAVTMPAFLVIGAAKSGTEALCAYLGEHPDVFMCPHREPNFLARPNAQAPAAIRIRSVANPASSPSSTPHATSSL